MHQPDRDGAETFPAGAAARVVASRQEDAEMRVLPVPRGKHSSDLIKTRLREALASDRA